MFLEVVWLNKFSLVSLGVVLTGLSLIYMFFLRIVSEPAEFSDDAKVTIPLIAILFTLVAGVWQWLFFEPRFGYLHFAAICIFFSFVILCPVFLLVRRETKNGLGSA